MRRFLAVFAAFTAWVGATEYPPQNSEAKTTFITLPKPCSAPKTSAATQGPSIYTPKAEEESTTRVATPSTYEPPVKSDSYLPYVYASSNAPSYAPVNTQTAYSSYFPLVEQDTSSTSSCHTPTTSPAAAVEQTTTSENAYPSASTQATAIVYPPATTQDVTTSTFANAYTDFPPAACPCPTEAASPLPISLPSLPLSSESLQGLDSLLSLIVSIPDTILDEGDEAVTAFYTNLSTCVGSKGETLKQSFVEFGTIFQDVAGNIEEEISRGVKDAGDFIGGLIKDGGDAVEDIASAVPDAIKSAFGPVISNILNFPHSISRVSRRETPAVLSSLAEILTGIDSLRACLASAIATNPVFEVAQCAASIASVVLPAAILVRAKGLISAAGGQKRVLKALAGAKNVGDVARGVLDVLRELSGIADVVKDCKFIVN